MRLKPSLSLVLLAALSGTYVIAQQPDGPPPSGKMDQGRGGWGEGMRSGFRIGAGLRHRGRELPLGRRDQGVGDACVVQSRQNPFETPSG